MRTLTALPISLLLVAAPVLAGTSPPPVPAPAPASVGPPSIIEMYARKPGSPAARSAVQKDKVKQVDLDAEPLEEVSQVDVQYEGAQRYRGIRLNLLISRFGPPPTTDLAILHFANGVAIPLPFRDDKVMSRLNPFVARGIRPDGATVATANFPAIAPRVGNFADVRAISFTGNKIAVAERYHPMVPEHDAAVLSPWVLADTLKSIEFVARAAWYRQLDVEPTAREAHEGFEVFARTCQFCHPVHQLGANFGPDFAEPQPITLRKPSPRSLFFHVRNPGKGAAPRAAMMPTLSHLDEEDTRVLHLWLRAIAEKPLPPYSP